MYYTKHCSCLIWNIYFLHILKQKENVPIGNTGLENNHEKQFLRKADLERTFFFVLINMMVGVRLIVYFSSLLIIHIGHKCNDTKEYSSFLFSVN